MKNQSIKGIYLEYYFDGEPDVSTLNIFMCEKYSNEDDSWGAEYNEEGIIEGPPLPKFFFFDPKLEWEDFEEIVGSEYANGLPNASFRLYAFLHEGGSTA